MVLKTHARTHTHTQQTILNEMYNVIFLKLIMPFFVSNVIVYFRYSITEYSDYNQSVPIITIALRDIKLLCINVLSDIMFHINEKNHKD